MAVAASCLLQLDLPPLETFKIIMFDSQLGILGAAASHLNSDSIVFVVNIAC